MLTIVKEHGIVVITRAGSDAAKFVEDTDMLYRNSVRKIAERFDRGEHSCRTTSSSC
jgi:hypothetical protein